MTTPSRVAETTTGATWPTLRHDLDRLHVGTFTDPAGTFRQRTDLTKAQRDILAKLQLPPPKQIVELATHPDPGRQPPWRHAVSAFDHTFPQVNTTFRTLEHHHICGTQGIEPLRSGPVLGCPDDAEGPGRSGPSWHGSVRR